MSEQHVSPNSPVASRVHTLGLLLITVALSWAGTISAARMRARSGPHRILSYSSMMIFDALITGYVVVGIRRHGGSLRQLVGGSWGRGRDFWRDLLIAITFWIVAIVCMGLLGLALHVNHRVEVVRLLAPQNRVEIALWVFVSLSAGFCEEIVFRGYLQRQFLAWAGKPLLGILLSAIVFGFAHAYQGAKHAVVLGAYGAMLGLLAQRRRSLRPGMMAHAWQDSLAGLLIRLHPN